MILHRVYPGAPVVHPDDEGGPLHAPWRKQRGGRHDDPDRFAAFYASEAEGAAIGEALQIFRGQLLEPDDLIRASGRRLMLATIEATDLELVDLDDPRRLTRLRERPSRIATGDREVTQAFARRMYTAGSAGLRWWSTLEASWINVTLFMDRCRSALQVVDLRTVTLDDTEVAAACDTLGIRRRSR